MPEKKKRTISRKDIGIIAVLIAILVILIYIISNSIVKFKANASTTTEKSIAVLPFKNIVYKTGITPLWMN